MATDSIMLADDFSRNLVRIMKVVPVNSAGDPVGSVSSTPTYSTQLVFSTAGTALTRPANQTPYSALDSISDNGTAGSVTANVVTLSDTNDQPIQISEITLASTDTAVAACLIRIHLFNSNPTTSSGVVGGDNAAWSNKSAGYIGYLSGTMIAFSDGSVGTLTPEDSAVRIMLPGSGAKTIWWQLQTMSAFTPSANSTTFTPRFKGWQGRAS